MMEQFNQILNQLIHQFHFLRPLWLLMLIPCLLMVARLWYQHQSQGSWQKVIAPQLLQHLLQEKEQRPNRLPLILLLIVWVLACLALAGPAWQKLPVSVSKSQQPLVVVTDLSYYMLAADLKPDRLTRTRYKLQDLFRLRKDGVSAIVAYAGSAHSVAPLTDDSRTLSNLVKAMNPLIMPIQGNLPEDGIVQAKKLLEQGSNESGDILLVTANMTSGQSEKIQDLLSGTDIRLSVLGVGTEQGAPIPLPEGGYLKNQQGTIIVPRLNTNELARLATATGGQYRSMTVNDSDLIALLPKPAINDHVQIIERDFDQWHDAGYWLLLILLPFALAGFRKGWLMVALLVILLPTTPEAQAFGWNDLWQTPDQQGQKALQQSDPQSAASLFEHPDWKGEALFQQQKFEESAAEFAKGETAQSAYNQANALAKAGKLQEAADAYTTALTRQPDFDDAKTNRKLVEQLLKQQQQDQKQQDQNKDQKNQDKKDKEDKKDQDKEKQDQQNQEQQNSENQQGGDQKEQNQQQNNQDQPTKEEQEKQQTQQNKKEPSPEDQKDQDQAVQQTQVEQDDDASSLEKQAVESWLRTIPDDPGGLLRRKFMQQQLQRQQQSGQGR